METLFTNENVIELDSTSYNTANANPIILNKTETIKTTFYPVLVDNENDPKCSVNGKLTHERKRKKDDKFPTEKYSKRDVKIGDILEIALSTTETKKLYDGLTELYKLHSDIGVVPMGTNSYAKMDSSLLRTIRQFENIKESCSVNDLAECITLLSKNLIDKENISDLTEKLKNIIGIEKISALGDVVNISKLKMSLEFFQNNIQNSNEEFWQQHLTDNQWIISQLFAYPTTIYKDKAYLGGKNIKNTNGKIVDYLYRNDLTKNVALVEIKTPKTELLGKEYRNNVYTLSDELSGSINQLFKYKDTLLKDWHCINENEDVVGFNPNCILIIGNTIQLDNPDKISNFELLRSNLKDVVIITFDELQTKIENLINSLSENVN